ncbi:ABC transporter permease [Actinomadura sp. NBRC 104412]|uniref:ABC transporter permease n=1 Tax=Actinomadura sp. NBRC 104412 TaxID=3032203 RepID=UPI00249FC8EA|nr:ABC transporter permease [Actinomadura sp. NBRC 104412]GLZ03995.1 ABC transporter permease [Actinomadura sp. NBRC 104412]
MSGVVEKAPPGPPEPPVPPGPPGADVPAWKAILRGLGPSGLGLRVGAPVLALLISLLITMALLRITGADPFSSITAMIDYGTTDNSIVDILNRATRYYLSAVAVAIGFRMALLNIGVDGQYRLAAMLSAALGGALTLPAPIGQFLVILSAMLIGGLWAAIAGVLKVTRGVSEVLSTIMLNAIATGLIAYLLNDDRLAEVRPGSNNVATAPIPESGRVGPFNDALTAIFSGPGLALVLVLGAAAIIYSVYRRRGDGAGENGGGAAPSLALGVLGAVVFVAVTALVVAPTLTDLPGTVYGLLPLAVVVGVVFWVVINHTRFGFDLRISGLSPTAAQASGVSARRMIVITMVASGAVAGLIGMPELLGASYEYSLNFPAGLGFTGITVALLGRNHPAGIALAALLFAFLDQTSDVLQEVDVPKEIVGVMQGVVVLTVVIVYELVRRWEIRLQQRTVADELATGHDLAATGGAAGSAKGASS